MVEKYLKPLDKDCLKALVQVIRDKRRYEKEASTYIRPYGLRGVFSRGPRDPWPQFEINDCVNLMGPVTKSCFSECNGSKPGPKGLEDYKSSFTLFVNHDGKVEGQHRADDNVSLHFSLENFEDRIGYGLIHRYSHSEDKKVDNQNRQYAYTRAMDSRLPGKDLDKWYRAMDSARVAVGNLLHSPDLEKSVVFSRMKEVFAFKRESESLSEKGNAVSQQYQDSVKKEGLESYLEHRVRERDFIAEHKDKSSVSLEDLYTYRGMQTVDFTRHFYESAYEELHGKIRESVKHLKTDSEVMDYAKLHFEQKTGFNPERTDSISNYHDFVNTFSTIAFEAGMPKKNAISLIEEDCRSHGMDSKAFVQEVVRTYVNCENDRRAELNSLIKEKRTMNVSTVVSHFVDKVESKVKRDLDVVEIEKKLLTPMLGDSFKLDSLMFSKDPNVLGELLFDMNGLKRYDTEAVTDAMMVRRGFGYKPSSYRRDIRNLIISSYENAAFRDFMSESFSVSDTVSDIKERSLSHGKDANDFKSMRRTTQGPVALLAQDLAVIASELPKEQLGRFLRETGYTHPNGTMADNFLKMASTLYGDGNANSVARIEKLRTDFSDVLKSGWNKVKTVMNDRYVGQGNAVGKEVKPSTKKDGQVKMS